MWMQYAARMDDPGQWTILLLILSGVVAGFIGASRLGPK